MNYGLQLYSIRDVAEKDFEAALKTAAEQGYTMVESAGFFGRSAEEVKTLLNKYGLVLCSTHTGYDALLGDVQGSIDFHKAVGCEDIIIPSAPFSTKEKLDALINNVNELLPVIEEQGLRLHYHNHSNEFLPNKDGLIAFDELAERTRVSFEIDTFWAYNAGLDPIALMEKYKERIRFIHLKDGIAQDCSDGKSCAVGLPLGSGKAPVAAVREKAIELGITMVVESEGLEPNGPEEVKRCIEYLRTLER